jgi:hypothetical protein
MKRLGTVSYLAVTAVCIYLAFTCVSLLFYPIAYSPLNNWLSDLGNPTKNPSGAIYYEIGGVLTSITLLLFFAGMYTWNTGNRKMKIFLTLSQVTGFVLALSFMITALFPLVVNDSVHSLFSIMLFVFIGFFEIFSASAIRRNPAQKHIAIFGFIIAIVNFGLGVSFNFANLFVGEWIMIGLFIAYIITLALTQNKHSENLKIN